MSLNLGATLDVLRAIGEETRLRIVALLQDGELTVSDLTDILGQSQPRISRHLKLLAEAGVVGKHREGTWAFFELTDDAAVGALVDDVLVHLVPDAVLAADRERLGVVRDRRAGAAQEYFASVAGRWDEVRSLHAPDSIVESAVVEMLGSATYRSILDLGTGTGRMLQLLADPSGPGRDTERAVGLDASHSMLAVARANLERSAIRRLDLRQGDVYCPPFGPDSFDVVVVHQVLHYLDDPARAVREAARLLTPGGRILIVDFAPHSLEFLRTTHAHRRLGFRDDTVAGWLEQAGLDTKEVRTIDAPGDDSDRLTVTLWLARDVRLAASAAGSIPGGVA